MRVLPCTHGSAGKQGDPGTCDRKGKPVITRPGGSGVRRGDFETAGTARERLTEAPTVKNTETSGEKNMDKAAQAAQSAAPAAADGQKAEAAPKKKKYTAVFRPKR